MWCDFFFYIYKIFVLLGRDCWARFCGSLLNFDDYDLLIWGKQVLGVHINKPKVREVMEHGKIL